MKPEVALLPALLSLLVGLAPTAHAGNDDTRDLADAGFVDGGFDAGVVDEDLDASDLDGGDLDGGVADERSWESACAISGSAYALRVDERVYPTCELVFGGPSLRERHEATRRSRILRVSASGGRIDVLHQDPTLHAPKVRGLNGLEVVSVLEAEVEELDCAAGGPDLAGDVVELAEGEEPESGVTREPVALVQLTEPFSAFCPADLYAVRIDDAIGAEGHVVALDPRGVLALYQGELLWVPRNSDARAPQFRLTWRSDFVLIVEDKKSKSTSKKKPRRRRRRGRR